MRHAPSPDGDLRDRSLRRVRVAGWIAGVGAAGLTAAFAAAAAHAFKGHGGEVRGSAPALASHRQSVTVPPPDVVPAIAGDPAPLQPPAQPPAPAPTATPSDPAPVSGGS